MPDWQIPLSDIDFGPEEEQAVLDVLRDGWLTMGPVTQAFEKEFAGLVGTKHAVAVSNGTTALHLACLALGIGPGDEVILPAFTFVATAAAILYTGAEVVFADVSSPTDLNVAPASIEELITPRTRALMLMHYGGYPCDMKAITALAEKHGLAVIEDAAHAIGAEYEGRACGHWSDVACFSFFSNKNLTTGEGGMVTTDDDSKAELLRSLRSHGMTTLSWDRYQGRATSYDVTNLGYNYRIDEMRSALGRVQLSKLEQNNLKRRALTEHYWHLLEKLAPQISLPFREHEGRSSYHIMPILLPPGQDRGAFMLAMKENGVQTSIHYPPIYHFSKYNQAYGDCAERLQVTEEVAARQVTLPLYPTLEMEAVEYIAHNAALALQT